MTKLASAFGDTTSLKTKTFELGGHTFKVRVPLSKEMDAIQERVSTLSQEILLSRFNKMTQAFRESQSENVTITDDDVIVDGRSSKELVETVYRMENRITEYVKLLIPENGTLDDLTYEDIENEWPLQVQFELLEKIVNAIQPGYKDTRKN